MNLGGKILVGCVALICLFDLGWVLWQVSLLLWRGGTLLVMLLRGR